MVCHCHSPLESLNLHDLLCVFFFGFWYPPNKKSDIQWLRQDTFLCIHRQLAGWKQGLPLEVEDDPQLTGRGFGDKTPVVSRYVLYYAYRYTYIIILIIYICVFSHKLYCRFFIQDLKYKRQRRQFSTSMMVFKRECQGSGCLDLHLTLVRKYRDGIDG